jgi:hypothetical protein
MDAMKWLLNEVRSLFEVDEAGARQVIEHIVRDRLRRSPFTWLVEVTVDERWVADGFELDDDRAQDMLERELSYATSDEVHARVLSAPPRHLVRFAQGYRDDSEDEQVEVGG